MKNGKVDIWPRCHHMRTQAHKGYNRGITAFYVLKRVVKRITSSLEPLTRFEA